MKIINATSYTSATQTETQPISLNKPIPEQVPPIPEMPGPPKAEPSAISVVAKKVFDNLFNVGCSRSNYT